MFAPRIGRTDENKYGITLAAVGGLGTADAATQVTRLESLRLGEFATVPFEAWVMDLSAINAARTREGDRPCDGLIGAAFLDFHHAVIDYPGRRMYLKGAGEGKGEVGRKETTQASLKVNE